MLTPMDLALGGVEIPVVDTDDLRRVWLRLQKEGNLFFPLLKQTIQAGSDPLAAYARATLLTTMNMSGLFAQWQQTDEFQAVAYQRVAEFLYPKA